MKEILSIELKLELIREKNKDSGCIYADLQTKGRGTYGKKWVSKMSKCIWALGGNGEITWIFL